MSRSELPAPTETGFKRPQLTRRECQVLTCFALGMSNQQVAEELNITSATVRNHGNNAFKSLGVLDRTQAAISGLQKGLILVETLSGDFDFSLFRRLRRAERKVLNSAIQEGQGATNKDIANRLKRSESTVKNTFGEIYSKLDIRDKTRVVVLYWLYRTMTREQIERYFPPQEEVFGGGKVKALASRNLEGEIIFVAPGSTKRLTVGEQQEAQATV